jgi:hypothetical protein
MMPRRLKGRYPGSELAARLLAERDADRVRGAERHEPPLPPQKETKPDA